MDPILFWNAVVLEVHRRDFTVDKLGESKRTGTFKPEQGGPTRTSRAFAIAHLAMYHAHEGAIGNNPAYPGFAMPARPAGTDNAAAVAGAAICVLTALYKHDALRKYVTEQGQRFIDQLGVLSDAIRDGLRFGDHVAVEFLKLRSADGSDNPSWYVPGTGRYQHRADPYNPEQGFTGARWGRVAHFVPRPGYALASYIAAPPNGGSVLYRHDYAEVKSLGSDTSATRTADQTVIGIYWGYDGAQGLGTPPRLYNQCVRAVIDQHPNDPRFAGGAVAKTSAYGKLFMMVNVAMADAGIIAWDAKYHYNLWRPVIGIREDDSSMGPAPGAAGVVVTGDPSWAPLGAPRTNIPSQFHTTPDFPAYPSGHATFGAAAFHVMQRFFGGERTFTFFSDEYNGVNRDPDGSVRPNHRRALNFAQAIRENSESRVYLGVHWRFDGVKLVDPLDSTSAIDVASKIGGVPAGLSIADDTFNFFNGTPPSSARLASKASKGPKASGARKK